MKNHPDRTELLLAVKSPSVEINSHLEKCQDCAEIFAMLVKFQVAGKTELTDAPAHLITKVKQLFEQHESVLAKLKRNAFELIFDSWSNLAPASVRNSAVLHERRIQFQAETLLFDLRAEKQKSDWNFTVQVTLEGSPDEVKVVIGKKEYSVNEFGLIQWNSKKPPTSIRLIDKDTSIELPEIRWKI